ncbi:hypothetical protein CRUP_029957 [Coryphaenoides rupestris]|nr:hypothetical protein CRUP_029957 [Coryphaenoides rupestris]
MGNQEAKQRKAAAAPSEGGSNTTIDEGWREGGGDKTKRGKKSLGRNEGKGAGGRGGGGGGGGETGTWPAKKKNKSESKSSVFSIRKRKSNLKGRGGAGSKEDVLSWQQDELDSAQSQGTKTPDLSDAEGATHCGPSAASQKEEAGGEVVQVSRRKGETVSPLEEGAPKGGSSGSDTDIYSFHSATDHDDLLADIQLAIRLQHQHNGIQLSSDTREGQEGGKRKHPGGDKNRPKDGGEAGGLSSSKVLQLTPELELEGHGEEDSKSDKAIEGLNPGKAPLEGGSPVGTATSVESLSECLSAESETQCPSRTSTTACVPVPQHRRAPSLWPPQESPSVSPRLLKKSPCSASSTSSLSSSVKPYPPIFPSYIKTTTRQLSSLGPSPGLSLAQSPLSHRRGHSQVHRTLAERRNVRRRQGSRGLGRPLSLSADWTEELELERGLRERVGAEDSEGSGEYLEGYGGGSQDRLRGGSQPLCSTIGCSSPAHVPACGLQDVFSGE